MNYIKLNGVDYPFSFSVLAQKEMLETDLTNKKDFELTLYFLWLGFKYGAIRKEKEFKLTENDLLSLFDDDYDAWVKAGELLGERLALMNQAREKK